jgi:beta-glucanase (GH16 family)
MLIKIDYLSKKNNLMNKPLGNYYGLKSLVLMMTVIFSFTGMKLSAQTYNLVWSDEFEYSGLPDSTKWSYDVGGGGWGNNELQYYTSKRTENARVENGNLIIEAIKEIYAGMNYTSARLVTKNQGDWLYGKVEVSAKLPAGRGTWPAIWMLPTDWEYGGWPSSGEIDIMEHVGYDEGRVHATIHTEDYNHMLGTQQGSSVIISDATTAFHTYSMEWTPIKIDFFADGVKYFTFYKYADDYKKWPFNKRFHLIMNIAVGGSWGGAQGVDIYAFPTRMEVAYVRVYQLSTGTASVYPEISMKKPGSVAGNPMIFPNPFNDHIMINYSGKIDQVNIYNCIGQVSLTYQDILAYNSQIDKLSFLLDLGNLESGIYFLSLKDQNGIVNMEKIIKY